MQQLIPFSRSTGTFAFPESSDIEDADDQDDGADDDYDFSDDDLTGKQQQSSEDGASIESQPPSAQKFDDAIDLTRDDTPEESNRIDLTGETPSEKNIMDVLAGRPNDMDHSTHAVSIGILAGNAPILVESEDEEFDAASVDTSEHSEDGASDSDGSDGSESSNMHLDEEIFPVSEESEAESEDMVIEDSYDIESVHDLSDAGDKEIPIAPIDAFVRYARAHDNSTISLSDIRTRTQLPESVADDEDEDNESEFGLSEAGEAGLRALIDGGLLQNEGDATSEKDNDSDSESEVESEPEKAPENESENEPEIVVTASSKESAEASVQPPTPESLPSLTAAARYATLQNFTGHNLGQLQPLIRQPSPSDAAMVKSAAPSQPLHSSINHELGHFGQFTAKRLGAKTGKTAFFEAREVNKAKFGTEAKPIEPTVIAPFKPTKPSSFGQSEAQTISNVGIGFGTSLGNIAKVTSGLGPTFPTREPCSFLDKPDQTRIPTRTSSPELDMTSAYSYIVSKNSATTSEPTPPNSRGIKIDDIIEPSTSQRPLRLKRKADEISDITDEELRLWAKASTSSTVSKPTLETPTTKTQATTKIAMTHPVPASSATSTVSEVRPTKRMKKLLENVGYAALGGVAVGAGLFTVLVATAPDFL
jgi:hypothetical protein